ncbi:MAG: DNA topoisomerase 4 subunit A [Eubacteriales bacterium]|jgi:DNA gyrase subunit A|nr:DNA topoisomerase 4 subunit A [Lachnospiraceae bacterium]MDD5859693.1 DNA topoisomerase 4 subunit A [Eubacteriales bacterium]MCH4064301.1 DNA topoisomerase 4 subunit A [Lachnospiraceae bacterium]MCH4102974.1 DNA topoisomerase 4 subunit A [Lachnospiraceae bacterium]MCI1308963.1 DNA topoisomerase 4 subunit A [Lachnospiraceae bacterium]
MSEKTANEERIIRTDYSEIMQKNYIDYAMSVIISRALPDVRDGLKPVQRRVLYDMYELHTTYDKPYRKSARIVGDTMGKYHPHGDSSIYDSLVVMAQDFKKGQTLVDGHGNFGSIEGDGAAAMRYTEARLEKFTQDCFLADLDRNIVDFVPNFDETEKEPTVLPARVPNILVNGSDGIAVGMATSIPPHNLAEVISAEEALIRNGEISDEELLRFVKGPDFPTGGIVVNKSDLAEIYKTGSGKIRIRGKVEIEKGRNGRTNIVVTEIPYTMIGSGIGKFMSDVAALAENRTCPEIADISNQSSKEGIRIVIECKKGADVENIRNLLYKKTKLEDTFGVNMLVVSGGRPETMSLRQILEAGVDFQFEINDRKYQDLLAKELERKEIQEGLIRACDVIDLIIEILRGSKSRKQAMDCLVMGVTTGIRFRSAKSRKDAMNLMFTERQANAILDMRLVKLIGLEIEALKREYNETLGKIGFYKKLLEDHDAMAEQIIKELESFRTKYARPRRTALTDAGEIVIAEKELKEEKVIFCLDRFGYAKILDAQTYEKNKETADAENRYILPVMNTDKVCIFTDKGRMHAIRVLDIPQKRLKDKGVPIDNLSKFSNQDEEILWVGALAEISRSDMLFVTANGFVKRTKGTEFIASTRSIQSTKLGEGDSLVLVAPSDEMDTVVLRSQKGYFIRFALSEVSELKKTAIGVRGIALEDGDTVGEAWLLDGQTDLKAEWHGSKVSLNRLKIAKRGGKGTLRR